jgi:zinc and cadmium transporter
MPLTLSLFCLAIVTVSVLGGLLPLGRVLNHTRLQTYLSFAAGAMLGAAFFHMLPEAVRVGSAATIRWSAAGLLTLFFLERFFSFHQHEVHDHTKPATSAEGRDSAIAEHTQCATKTGQAEPRGVSSHTHRPTGDALHWASTAVGLTVHSLVGGIALASAVAADFEVGSRLGATGLGVFFATLVHKPADALTITSLMIQAGATRRLAHLVNLGFSLMIPAGVILFSVGLGGTQPGTAASWMAGGLAFSAGTFLCIALSDILPELQFHSHDRLKLSIALLAGLGLMWGAAALEPGEPAHAAASASKPANR